MVKIIQTFEGPERSRGDEESHEEVFLVTGTDDPEEAEDEVLAETDELFQMPSGNILYRQRLTSRPVGPDSIEVRLTYGTRAGEDQEQDPDDATISFDTTGGTAHITNSLATVGSYAPPGKEAPDCKGMIGVNGDSVDGVDIVVPAFNWTEEFSVPDDLITHDYVRTLSDLTGTVNNAAFRGYAAGEVLYMGATGAKRSAQRWAMSHRFVRSPNVNDLQVGNITGITKEGHDYLWISHEPDESQMFLVRIPAYVKVERVYLRGDFSRLRIGL